LYFLYIPLQTEECVIAFGVSSGGDLVIKHDGIFLFELMLTPLILGSLGGYEIGRYAEMEFSKRRITNKA